MRPVPVILIGVLGALLLSAGPAHADCVSPGSPAEERREAAAVFEGVVVAVDRPWWRILGYGSSEPFRYAVEVDKVYKGDVATTVPVVAFTSAPAHAVGDRLLVFADEGIYGLVMKPCSLSGNRGDGPAPFADGYPPRPLTVLERVGVGPAIAVGIALVAGVWVVRRWRRRHPIRRKGRVST
jgi:hypothetical protein